MFEILKEQSQIIVISGMGNLYRRVETNLDCEALAKRGLLSSLDGVACTAHHRNMSWPGRDAHIRTTNQTSSMRMSKTGVCHRVQSIFKVWVTLLAEPILLDS